MRIFGLDITRKKPKNRTLDPETYSSDFWSDIANASSTDKGMKLAAVYRCIDVLSDNISMLPWATVDSGTHEKPDDQYAKQVWYLLNIRPNRNMSPAVFFKTLEQHRLGGNAYAEITTARNGLPTELVILLPNRVQTKLLDNGDVVYDVADKNGIKRRLISDEILHFKNMSDDGLIGKSVLSFASDCVANMTYQEEFSKAFYRKGGRPSGILAFETDMSDVIKKRISSGIDKDEAGFKEKVRADFQSKVSGANAGSVAVLDNGAKYHPVQPISQKDMAFIESKESSIADICRFYGVPLFMLFAGKESYASNEQNNIAFVTGKLNPIVTGYEQELTYKFYSTERVRSGVQVKANLNILLRGDSAARSTYYAKMHNMGAMSVNDIRAKEDMRAVAGGDTYMANLNYVPLKDFERLSNNRNEPVQPKNDKEGKESETE